MGRAVRWAKLALVAVASFVVVLVAVLALQALVHHFR